MWTITYVVYLHVGNIFRSNIYLCFVHLSRNEVIISRASPDGVESEQLIGCNRARSSLVQTSALLSVLVRVIGYMTRAHLWYVISPSQGYWLDDEGAPSECHQVR